MRDDYQLYFLIYITYYFTSERIVDQLQESANITQIQEGISLV